MKRVLIQPDARGRIQLPKEYRGVPVFELEEAIDGLRLLPLETRRKSVSAWLNEEVSEYLMKEFKAHIDEYLNTNALPGLVACFLYGSRARGDALTNSDIDLALVCETLPSKKLRDAFVLDMENNAQLQDDLQVLRSHGVKADFSIQFFRIPSIEEIPPAIYFNFILDGLLLWQVKSEGSRFVERIGSSMKQLKARASGEGKSRTWTWRVS